jgi:hypothetical protein
MHFAKTMFQPFSRRPTVRSEKGWNIVFAKCITSESSAGTIEDQNGSDLIPGDHSVLACFGKTLGAC